MAKFQRVNVSMPADLAAKLRFVAHRLGVSQSALISLLLKDSLIHMFQVLEILPTNGEEIYQSIPDAKLRRLRGDSVRLVKAQYDAFMEEVNKESTS